MSDLLEFSPPGQVTFSLAGARARFFNAGTTTPRIVYADEAETIAHPSPLLADSNGRFAQAFVSGGAVKVVVTQADESTGYTLDPCTKVSATGSAASSVSFTPSVLRPQTNVQDAIDNGTFPARTITAGTGVTVTNGNGVAGNPIIAVSGITTAQIAAAAIRLSSEGFASPLDTELAAALWVRGLLQDQNVNLGTSVASTSGTAIDFTGIPPWAKRVTVMLSGVSTSGTDRPCIRLGTSGGIVATGYVGVADSQNSGGGSTNSSSTEMLLVRSAVTSASNVLSGQATFTNVSGNNWVGTFVGSLTTGVTMITWAATQVSLSGVLTQLRITTVSGADTFDAGTINISWE